MRRDVCLCCGRWVPPDVLVCEDCAELEPWERGHVFMGREKGDWADGY